METFTKIDQAMETFTKIVEFLKISWGVAGKWFGYLNGLDDNMRNLKRKVKDLSDREDDLNADLNRAEQPGKRRKKEVAAWLEDVQPIKNDVEGLEQQVARERNHILSRARLGKQIVEKIQEVEKLQEKGRFSGSLVIDVPTSGLPIPTGSFFGGTTCVKNKNEVWNFLRDEEVRRIGIYGMGGSGKTTIMHHINNELIKGTTNFEDTIWVTVSKAFDTRKVQDQIAKALQLDLPNYEGDETRRASELHLNLSKRKRYVLILDDLWEAFPLHEVGIPEPTSSNGCKLVLTTRSFEVCRRMECIPVKVELLTEQEAWDLFMSKAVEHGKALAPGVEPIARKVAKECARLPLAIITTAGSMRGVNDIHEWRNALNALISSTKQIKDSESMVYERLKFSYSRLEDEKLQNCFLYCALYPEDYKIEIEELIEYWIAEGLISEVINRELMLDEGYSILKKLVNTCLLESNPNDFGLTWVRMHDLIRDMALKITAGSPRFMVHAGEGLERVPCEEYWSKDLERVSLIYNKIEVLALSRPPNCPQLTTLLLRKNPLSDISDSFFKHMRLLKVLDLSYTDINSLPESISNLKSLHGLFLKNCEELEYVPSLEKLKVLKELNLHCCNIQDVPQGIEELVNLIDLDLSDNENLQTFPWLKLQRLPQLQYLRIDGTNVLVSAKDLSSSRQLKTLAAVFVNAQELTSYVASQQFQILEHYYLAVGTQSRHTEFDGFAKIIEICDSKLFGSGLDRIVLPSNMEELYIDGCRDLKCLSDILPQGISLNLKILNLESCSSMKNIFTATKLLQYFPNLEHLYVADCENVEDLMVEEGEVAEEMRDSGSRHQIDNNSITLRNLWMLWLAKLPKLKSIYKGIMVCESLEVIRAYNCPMLRRLPLASSTPRPALREIMGQEEWWESLEWDDPHFKATLQPFYRRPGCGSSARFSPSSDLTSSTEETNG